MKTLLIFPMIASILLFGSCSNFDPGEYDEIDLTKVIQFSASSSVTEADGKSRVVLQATIPAKSDIKVVTFTSSAGTLIGAKDGTLEVVSDSAGIARAELVSSLQVEDAKIRARVGNYVREMTIQFERAYPDRVTLDIDAFQLKAGMANELKVIARLGRDIGTPSIGTKVLFSMIADSTGERIELIRGQSTSDGAGLATAIISAGNTSYRGSATVFAQSEGVDTIGSARVWIADPE